MLVYICLFFQSVLLCWIIKEYVYMKKEYIKAKTFILNILKMTNIDSILDEMLVDEPKTTPTKTLQNSVPSEAVEKHRERLIALVVGGKANVYLGQSISVDKIEGLSNGEVEKLYARYESRLGATMTKTLGQSICSLYALVAGRYLPIPFESQDSLRSDLEKDPFVGHALTTITCELYHKYGMYLAPITAALTTAKYCEFKQIKSNANINNDGKSINGEATCGDTTCGDATCGESNCGEKEGS